VTSVFKYTVTCQLCDFYLNIGWVESILGPRGTAAMYWPIVPVPGDCDGDGEFGGMNGFLAWETEVLG
jgi:hypothetical protein